MTTDPPARRDAEALRVVEGYVELARAQVRCALATMRADAALEALNAYLARGTTAGAKAEAVADALLSAADDLAQRLDFLIDRDDELGGP